MDWQIVAILILLMLSAGMFIGKKGQPQLVAMVEPPVVAAVEREPAQTADVVQDQEELSRYMQGLFSQEELPAARDLPEPEVAPQTAASPTMSAASVAAAFVPVLKLNFAVP